MVWEETGMGKERFKIWDLLDARYSQAVFLGEVAPDEKDADRDSGHEVEYGVGGYRVFGCLLGFVPDGSLVTLGGSFRRVPACLPDGLPASLGGSVRRVPGFVPDGSLV
jgi:hypothetical protein